MIDSREYPEVQNLLEVSNPPFGKASFMNTLKVDFEKYPDIAKISMFKIALLGPGDFRIYILNPVVLFSLQATVSTFRRAGCSSPMLCLWIIPWS